MPRITCHPALAVLALLVLAGACDGCLVFPGTPDAGNEAGPFPDGGGPDPTDGGDPGDASIPPDGDPGPFCTEDAPGFGEPCANFGEDPPCGQFVCDPQTDQLVCFDLGPNDCGGCDELDESQGRVREACGQFGCGVAECNEDGSATVCVGDHPRNQCGGCADILPSSHEPGQVCSACGTGIRTCTRDQNSLVCWRGRSPTNSCGGCDRCVLFHAFMDERFDGAYIRSGTLAILEDIGDGNRQLVFDPLVEGPGANALVLTRVLLSTTLDPLQGSFTFLTPDFAASTNDVLADPVRAYTLNGVPNIGQYRYVVLYDFFFQSVISVGELISGAPPTLAGEDAGSSESDAGGLDAGEATDAADLDATGGTEDATAPPDASGDLDGGADVQG